jgi:hypothetical protein
MVVEINPRSVRSISLKPFFLFKNRPFQIYGLYSVHSSASIGVKTFSPDPADFAMTQLLFHWHIALGRLRYSNIRTTIAKAVAKWTTKCWQFALKARWSMLAVFARVVHVQPLAYCRRHSAICQGTLPDMPQSGK